jgi:hypothetical protein
MVATARPIAMLGAPAFAADLLEETVLAFTEATDRSKAIVFGPERDRITWHRARFRWDATTGAVSERGLGR